MDHPQRYRFQAPIPEPVIYPPSPTSSGIGAAINVLTSPDFTIDWITIKEDYYSDKNASLHAWFEQIDRNLREEIKKEWIADMNCMRVNLAFFSLVSNICLKEGYTKCLFHPQY